MQTNQYEKNISKIKNDELKTRSSEYRAKRTKKYRIFQSKNTYSSNARNSYNIYKKYHKIKNYKKSKTLYNMTDILIK